MVCGDELVLLGKVTGPHGIKGQLKVVSFSGDADALLSVDSVILRMSGGKLQTYELASAKVHGKKVLISLKDFNDINQVLHLVGSELLVQRSQLPELEPGEYYWHDVLGMVVVTEEGEQLGEVADVVATGSNDVFVVQSAEGEILIPATEEVVKEMDFEGRIIRVILLDGLREL